MTDKPQTPQEGIADAIGDLSGQTRALVHQEIEAAQQEMWSKAKAAAPVLGLTAATAAFGLCAAAALYRYSLRLLERNLHPASAALLASVGYGAAAASTAAASVLAARSLPPLFPVETVRQTGAGIAEATTRR